MNKGTLCGFLFLVCTLEDRQKNLMEVVNTKDLEIMCNDLRQTLIEPPEFETIKEIKYLMSCLQQSFSVKKESMDRALQG